MTRYLPGKSADQEVYLERIYNQNSVRLDPSREQPDGSDAEWGFYGTDMLWTKFKDVHPDAEASGTEDDGLWRSLVEKMPGWFTGEGEGRAVRVMNYYYTIREAKVITHLSNGHGATEDELATLPAGVTVLMENGKPVTHTDTERKVKWCKLVGNEVLERTDWPGQWIPILQIVGEELQPYDEERRSQGIVRPMRDSCKANNYLGSKFVERVGLTPLDSWMLAAGQDDGFDDEYNAANTRAIGRLHYNQRDNNDEMVSSPPFRSKSTADVNDLAQGMQIFGQAIVSTSVTPETALGQVDPSVKSGKLARALIDQASRGTSNFMDNLVRTERHEARVVNDLLYPIYGRTGRPLRILNGQGEHETVLMGVPFMMQGSGKNKRPVPVQLQPGQPMPENVKLFKLTPDADFNVATKISKNIDTRRQQIVTFLGELIGADPSQMLIIGDKLWQYLDVPDHAEMEKRYRVMLAPPIQKLLSGDTPLPPEAESKIAMLEQQLQALQPLADKNQADLAKTQIQEQEETKRTQIKVGVDAQQGAADREVKLAVAEIAALSKQIQSSLQVFADERARLGVQIQDTAEAQAQRQHEMAIAAQEHQQAMQQADQGQQHALEQGQQQGDQAQAQAAQGHQQTLEQQQQAAALQPPPEASNG